jgi:hypothetical protein
MTGPTSALVFGSVIGGLGVMFGTFAEWSRTDLLLYSLTCLVIGFGGAILSALLEIQRDLPRARAPHEEQ